MTAQSNAIYNLLSPNKVFQDQNGVCPIISVVFPSVTVTTNNLLITAVTGKRVLVVGGSAYSNGAFTQLTFRSASGGTAKRSVAIPANTVAAPNIFLCPNGLNDSFETNTGEGLYVDNSAVIAILSLNYLVYTP